MKKLYSLPFVFLLVFAFSTHTVKADSLPADYSSCLELVNNFSFRSTDAQTGGEVSALQDFLYPEFLKQEPTGRFFGATRNAVIAFQRKHGIPAGGGVGPITRAKIKEISCGVRDGSTPSLGLNWEYVKARIAPPSLTEAELISAITGNAQEYYANIPALTSSNRPTGFLRVLETKNTQYPYIALHHVNLGERGFHVEMITSRDLKTWTTVKVVSDQAGMPEMVILPDNAVLYAEETTIPGEAPYIRVKYFKSLDGFISSPNRPDAETKLPPMPNSWANGTPRFGRITYNGDIYNSKIEILHHFFKGPVGNQVQRDQQAQGILTNFASWVGSENIELNQVFDRIGYTDNGDRDIIKLNDTIYQVMEARPSITAGWDAWRTFLVNKNTNTVKKIDTKFPQGGYSPGNPKVSFITLPDGKPGLVAAYYVYYGGTPALTGSQLFVYSFR